MAKVEENKIRIRCSRKDLAILRAFITEKAEECGLKPFAIHEMNVVGEELGYNIIKYARLEEPGEFEVEIQSLCGRIRIIFRDSGIPFDPTVYKGGLRFDVHGNLKVGQVKNVLSKYD